MHDYFVVQLFLSTWPVLRMCRCCTDSKRRGGVFGFRETRTHQANTLGYVLTLLCHKWV